jgi:predicted transposase/invertase (TIGR01784 family)
MQQAIGAYRSGSATPEFREIERLRSKARHDEAQALKHARLEGLSAGRYEGLSEGRNAERIQIVRNMAHIGMDVDTIAKATKLTIKQVDEILQSVIEQ